MKNIIAKNMISILQKHSRTIVWYGDIDLIEECAFLSGLPNLHPKVTIQRILNALDKSQLFQKGYIISDYSGVKRKYRCFTIK